MFTIPIDGADRRLRPTYIDGMNRTPKQHFDCGDLVTDKRDPRHVARITSIGFGGFWIAVRFIEHPHVYAEIHRNNLEHVEEQNG